MRKRLSVNMAAAGLAALALGGCFSPQPDPSKFFVLAPVATGGANSIASAGLAASSSTTIGLGPIKLPQYLDRDEVVTRVGPNRLELSDHRYDDVAEDALVVLIDRTDFQRKIDREALAFVRADFVGRAGRLLRGRGVGLVRRRAA